MKPATFAPSANRGVSSDIHKLLHGFPIGITVDRCGCGGNGSTVILYKEIIINSPIRYMTLSR